MSRYEDFKVGDVWVMRNGKDASIDVVEQEVEQSYPIYAQEMWYRHDGTVCIDDHQYDLVRKKTNPDTPLSIAAKIAASQARVEAMKAKNAALLRIGESEEYGYVDFFTEAQLLEQLADEAVRGN